jgi:hypothetical protein
MFDDVGYDILRSLGLDKARSGFSSDTIILGHHILGQTHRDIFL